MNEINWNEEKEHKIQFLNILFTNCNNRCDLETAKARAQTLIDDFGTGTMICNEIYDIALYELYICDGNDFFRDEQASRDDIENVSFCYAESFYDRYAQTEIG